MLRLLKGIWNGIKGFFGQFVGTSSPNRQRRSQRGDTPETVLSDTDYEFLFSQLLEGIAHGWHGGRIARFFDQLGEKGQTRLWLAWLDRFEDKVLASSAPNLQLAARLMRLGELVEALPKVEPIGKKAYDIGSKLYQRQSQTQETVWEYEGPDATASTSPITDNDQNNLETITLEELMGRLQQDPNLVAQLAQQLGTESQDPQELVDHLVEQFTQQQEDHQPPNEVEQWFDQGLQQADRGDLEGAIISWDHALALDPQLSEAWHNRGSALGSLGRLNEAIDSFDQALQLTPEDAQIWNAKGSAYYQLQDWESAIACWEQVIQRQSEFAEVWYNCGTALEQLGRTEEAITYYQKALSLKPDLTPAQARLQALAG